MQHVDSRHLRRDGGDLARVVVDEQHRVGRDAERRRDLAHAGRLLAEGDRPRGEVLGPERQVGSLREQPIHVLLHVPGRQREEHPLVPEPEQRVVKLEVAGREPQTGRPVLPEHPGVQRVVEVEHDRLQPRGERGGEPDEAERAGGADAGGVRQRHAGDARGPRVDRSRAQLGPALGERHDPDPRDRRREPPEAGVDDRGGIVEGRRVGDEDRRVAPPSQIPHPLAEPGDELAGTEALPVPSEVQPQQLDVGAALDRERERIVVVAVGDLGAPPAEGEERLQDRGDELECLVAVDAQPEGCACPVGTELEELEAPRLGREERGLPPCPVEPARGDVGRGALHPRTRWPPSFAARRFEVLGSAHGRGNVERVHGGVKARSPSRAPLAEPPAPRLERRGART